MINQIKEAQESIEDRLRINESVEIVWKSEWMNERMKEKKKSSYLKKWREKVRDNKWLLTICDWTFNLAYCL